MKFFLFVEGNTERKSLQEFLKRWLDPQLKQPVGINIVEFEGWADYDRRIKRKVEFAMSGKTGEDAIAGIGLLDLYGPTIYPAHLSDADARRQWAKKYFEDKVGHAKFRQHFAVHETEAWLLSDLTLLPTAVAKALPGKTAEPETVNFDNPPSHQLAKAYREKKKRHYKKTVDGTDLFRRLDPTIAYSKCPSLQALLDDLLGLARAAGL